MAVEETGVKFVAENATQYVNAVKTASMETAKLGQQIVKSADESQKAQSKFSSLANSISGIVKIATGVAIGIQLPGALIKMAQAAAEDSASMLRLQRAVENTGAAWDDYSDVLNAVIKRGQELGFSDDETRDSLALLTAQTDSAEEAVKRYALAQDLARGANIDVVTASRLLGRVTEENVNVLARYGISVKEGATETELFAAIYAKFNGQAQTFADSTAGKMARLRDSMSELRERIGTVLLPVLTSFTDFTLKVLIPALEKIVDVGGKLASEVFVSIRREVEPLIAILANLSRYILAVVKDGDTMNDWLTHLPPVMRPVVQLFGDLGVAVAGAGKNILDFVSEIPTKLGELFAEVKRRITESTILFGIGFELGAVPGGAGELDPLQRAALEVGVAIAKISELFNELGLDSIFNQIKDTALQGLEAVKEVVEFLGGSQAIIANFATVLLFSATAWVAWTVATLGAAKATSVLKAFLAVFSPTPLGLIAIFATAILLIAKNWEQISALPPIRAFLDELAELIHLFGTGLGGGEIGGEFTALETTAFGLGQAIRDLNQAFHDFLKSETFANFKIGLATVAEGIAIGFGAIKEATIAVIPVIREVIETFVELIGQRVAMAILVGAVTALGVALVLTFAPVPAAILAVTLALGALITGIGYLRANWEEIPGWIRVPLELAWQIITFTVELIVERIVLLSNIIKNTIELVTAVIHGDWARAWSEFKDIVAGAIELAIKSVFGPLLKLGDVLKDEAYSIGKKFVEGLWDGINSLAGWLKSKVSEFANGVVNTVKSGFGVFSPSRVMMDIGKQIVRGLEIGLADINRVSLLGDFQPPSLRMTAMQSIAARPNVISNSNQSSLVIENISLPNVTNWREFINEAERTRERVESQRLRLSARGIRT